MSAIVRIEGQSNGFECSACREYLGEERIVCILRQREPDKCPYCNESFEGIIFVAEFDPKRLAIELGYLL